MVSYLGEVAFQLAKNYIFFGNIDNFFTVSQLEEKYAQKIVDSQMEKEVNKFSLNFVLHPSKSFFDVNRKDS